MQRKKSVITVLATLFLVAMCMALVACGGQDYSPKKLPTPSRPEKNGANITWQDNPMYTDFVVCVDGDEYTTNENTFDVAFALDNGEAFDVKVKAVGDDKYYADSDWSEVLTVTPFNLTMEKVSGGYKIKKCFAASGDIVLPDDFNGFPVVEIGISAFKDCNDITSVTIPHGYTTINAGAFEGCANLQRVDIPDSVTRISGRAFERCKSLKELYIPKSVLLFTGFQHFPHSSLEELTVDADNPTYKSDGNCLILKSDNSLLFANEYSTIPSYVESIALNAICSETIESFSIPNGIKRVDHLSFKCPNLKRVEISASVTEISPTAFGYKQDLTEFVVAKENPMYKSDCGHVIRKSDNVLVIGCSGNVVIPDYVTGLGDDAFRSCHTQPALKIPKSVTWLGRQSLASSTLEYVYLPDTLKKIGWDAFVNDYDASGKYAYGTRSITLPEGCEYEGCTGAPTYAAPECEIGYDDGYAYVVSYTESAINTFFNTISDKFFIYDESRFDYGAYPYRYGYTFGGFSATLGGSRISTSEEFQQTIFMENGINKTRVYPIWIPNENM